MRISIYLPNQEPQDFKYNIIIHTTITIKTQVFFLSARESGAQGPDLMTRVTHT